MSKKKAADLVPKIIEANDRNSAIEVLNDVLEALYLTQSYTEMVYLQDKLKGYQKQYREISDEYRSLDVPKRFDDVHNVRVDLNFLYRDIVDELDFDINRLKIYYEEGKTTTRADAISALKQRDEYTKKSESSLRDIVGMDDGYKEYVALVSMSYGMYKALNNLLTNIKMMADSLASECNYLKNIEIKE